MGPSGYSTQKDYMNEVRGKADARYEKLETTMLSAFGPFIEKREVDVIVFSGMNAFELGQAIFAHPMILKPLIACCNIAGRALGRDLGVRTLDTYAPRLSEGNAKVVAGYIKPFLPTYVEIPALARIDRIAYVDKEIRKNKGRWEQRIVETLNRLSITPFRKRNFQVAEEAFELDAASPEKGTVKIGIDVKRIEDRRDIHKRCDEIVNKAVKLKVTFPASRFAAVIYYPFIDEHISIQSRLRSEAVDVVVFASDHTDSIENAIRLLLATVEGQK